MQLDLRQPRHHINVDGSEQIIGKIDLADGEEISTSVQIDHLKPKQQSRTTLKAVVRGKGKVELNANLHIGRNAQYTDSYLKIAVLLVDPESRAVVIPGLEIETDQVKGGHGATIGHLDAEQVFYLQSRGLTVEKAKSVLIDAFLHSN